MSEIIEKLEKGIGRKVAHNEPLSEYFLEVEKIDDLIKSVLVARELEIPVVVIGSGSSLAYPDETILGLIIKNNCRKFDKMSMHGKIQDREIGVSEVLVQAESGTLLNQLVRFTIEEGLEGLEYQLGLPGTVGDAIYTNASYRKYHMRDSLQAIRVLNAEGKITMHMDEFDKHIEDDILLSAIFRMTPASKKVLWERGKEAGEYRTKHAKK